VRAGLNPIDWMEIIGGEGKNLHKIVLNERQAELCVVAEALFRPTTEELVEFSKKTHTYLAGIKRRYDHANYEKSFVPLLEYTGGYNLPEVLIPFPVTAESVCCVKIYILFWKLKKWLTQKIRKNINPTKT